MNDEELRKRVVQLTSSELFVMQSLDTMMEDGDHAAAGELLERVKDTFPLADAYEKRLKFKNDFRVIK